MHDAILRCWMLDAGCCSGVRCWMLDAGMEWYGMLDDGSFLTYPLLKLPDILKLPHSSFLTYSSFLQPACPLKLPDILPTLCWDALLGACPGYATTSPASDASSFCVRIRIAIFLLCRDNDRAFFPSSTDACRAICHFTNETWDLSTFRKDKGALPTFRNEKWGVSTWGNEKWEFPFFGNEKWEFLFLGERKMGIPIFRE